MNCQRSAALVVLAVNTENQLKAHRYSILALSCLSEKKANHPAILEVGGLESIFSSSNSPVTMSQNYVDCALANLSCNTPNHLFIAEEGGLQLIVTLAYSVWISVGERTPPPTHRGGQRCVGHAKTLTRWIEQQQFFAQTLLLAYGLF